jgi:hypothetical protein
VEWPWMVTSTAARRPSSSCLKVECEFCFTVIFLLERRMRIAVPPRRSWEEACDTNGTQPKPMQVLWRPIPHR